MKVNSQLAESKTQLDKTFTTISENERKLADGWSKYNTKKS